ncbi:hypothetical protein [Phenylobacterium sp.]|uniref:hypothetical protein n=1 Tax=Phenylobacterium sp. TaxID=1871053 RepID=UPI0025D8E11B|nr:hypothetical protein [Phenylobacterium sp.]MBX3482741.1 hypothetical protein [Phenylobacterium sp.]
MTPAPKPAAPASQAPVAETEAAGHAALLEKARAVTRKVARLKRDFAGAHRLAHDAQMREALVRTELTLALHESLVARSELQAKLREQALAALRARPERRLRRHNRLSRMLDKALARLGSVGQALVIARSGVWRGTGRPLHDLRHMAAYARRRARADVTPLAPVDQRWYLDAYPDVGAARTAPLVHYLVSGDRERRRPGPLFDPQWYARQAGAELGATGLSPLEHYRRVGAVRGLSPHPAFDVGHYLSQVPALEPGDDPLSHYMREGGFIGLSPHPAFDPAWYQRQAGEAMAGRPALLHYLGGGWKDGLSPHPLFDPRWYQEHYPMAAETGLDPFTHFLAFGGAERLSPGPWFDGAHYVESRGAALAPGANPLVDYLTGGAWAVAEARPGFPTVAYLASRPELARTGVTPLEHWARRAGR